MEAQDDHAGMQNEVKAENILLNANGTQPSDVQITQNRGMNNINPFLNPFQTTANGLHETNMNPFSTPSNDSSGNTASEFYNNHQDFMSTHGQNNGWPHFPTSSPASSDSDWTISPPPTPIQEINQTTFPSQKWDTFQDSETARNSANTNIFESFKEETSSLQKIVAHENKNDDKDFLLDYILSNTKNDAEPISSPTASNPLDLLENSSSFLPSSVNSDNTTSTAPSQLSDIFQTPESGARNRVFQTIQLFQNATPGQKDLMDSHLTDNGQLKPQDSPVEKMSTPTEVNYGIFQEPCTSSSTPIASASGEQMFKRRPPKPTPRNKAPKILSQSINNDVSITPAVCVPADEKPTQAQFTPTLAVPKPTSSLPPAKTIIQDTMSADNVNEGLVYEDILFIGQEKCVEDWPEDSPEMNPDWKPTGKFKLRRESLRLSESGLNKNTTGRASSKMKMKLRLTKKLSKDKSGDNAGALGIDTFHQEPNLQEKYSDLYNNAYGETFPHEKKEKYSDLYDGETLPNEKKFDAPVDLLWSEQEEKSRTKSKSVKSKKQKQKFLVPHLQYRGSKKQSVDEDFENGSPFLQDSKGELEPYEDKLRNSIQNEQVMKDCRPKEPLKYKRSLSHQLSKDDPDDLNMMNGLSFLDESKENISTDTEDEYLQLPAELRAAYQDESLSQKSSDSGGKIQDFQAHKTKKSKFKVPHIHRKHSKNTLESDIHQKGANSFQASDSKPLEINLSENYSEMRNSPGQRRLPTIPREIESRNETEKGADLFKAGDSIDDEPMEKQSMDSKTKKLKNSYLPSIESQSRDQLCFSESIDPPGATSGDYYLSEAAKAEWMSSQMDVRRASAMDKDEELEAVEEEEEGDTDSLMEWWNTVELWDELPSTEESGLKEDETKSFTEIADKVHRGLRVFYKTFTEQAEVLYQHVLRLYAIDDDLMNFHRRAKIANITGGTTTAVGGAAAIAGLALIPVTFGASLIVSAIGLGIATAGGITAASAAISDNVHDMNDRKKIEEVLQDYELRLVELRRSLSFVAEGVRRLRFHPLLRRNNYYVGDWELRRALQTISLVGEPVEQAEETMEKSIKAVNKTYKGMDNYFVKDSKELKKGCKKEVTMQVNMLAKLLHEGLVTLNAIREQLMEATGQL